jgi:hypothetical protein
MLSVRYEIGQVAMKLAREDPATGKGIAAG